MLIVYITLMYFCLPDMYNFRYCCSEVSVTGLKPGEGRVLGWKCCKLIIDPELTGGVSKLYRYDGQYFSTPVSETVGFTHCSLQGPVRK